MEQIANENFPRGVMNTIAGEKHVFYSRRRGGSSRYIVKLCSGTFHEKGKLREKYFWIKFALWN